VCRKNTREIPGLGSNVVPQDSPYTTRNLRLKTRNIPFRRPGKKKGLNIWVEGEQAVTTEVYFQKLEVEFPCAGHRLLKGSSGEGPGRKSSQGHITYIGESKGKKSAKKKKREHARKPVLKNQGVGKGRGLTFGDPAQKRQRGFSNDIHSDMTGKKGQRFSLGGTSQQPGAQKRNELELGHSPRARLSLRHRYKSRHQ